MIDKTVLYKFIFEDSGTTKTIRGYVHSEDESTFKIIAIKSNDLIVIGKRCIIKFSPIPKEELV
jgi:hypothetical protein